MEIYIFLHELVFDVCCQHGSCHFKKNWNNRAFEQLLVVVATQLVTSDETENCLKTSKIKSGASNIVFKPVIPTCCYLDGGLGNEARMARTCCARRPPSLPLPPLPASARPLSSKPHVAGAQMIFSAVLWPSLKRGTCAPANVQELHAACDRAGGRGGTPLGGTRGP